MALLTPTAVTTAGVVAAPGAMTVSNTITGSLVSRNAIIGITNGSGGSINATWVDPGTTPAGNTGTSAAVAIAAGATRWFRLSSAYVDPDDSLITLTLSSATSVTYQLYYV